MENLKDLIGKKVRGFKFEGNYNPEMNKYIGRIGVIKSLQDKYFLVSFGHDSWWYPVNKISRHLVEETYPVTRKQLSEIYDSVCDKWKSEINTIIDKGGRFSESFEVPQSLIWRARAEANTKQCQWIESVFGEVKKELEIGKWYKVTNLRDGCLGFNGFGEIVDVDIANSGLLEHEENTLFIRNINGSVWRINSDATFIESTQQEVEKALIEEAKRRGFVKGVVFESLIYATPLQYSPNLIYRLIILQRGGICEIVMENQFFIMENGLPSSNKIKLK